MSVKLLFYTTCLLVVSAAACTSRIPVVTSPDFPNFIFPYAPTEYADSPSSEAQSRAWAYLQSGDLAGAAERFEIIAARDPNFYPASVALGWTKMAQGLHEAAINEFQAVLEEYSTYVPALVGVGEAFLGVDRLDMALENFEEAIRVNPSLRRITESIGGLRLRVMRNRLGEARAAAEKDNLQEAEKLYELVIKDSPDSGFLYVEMALLKQRRGLLDEALIEVRRAINLDRNDGEFLVVEGDLLEALGEFAAAEEVFRRADTVDPSPETASRLERAEERRRLARLPALYHAIPRRATVSRGELAALVGVQLEGLLDEASFSEFTPIITDSRGHWASQWILLLTRTRVMSVDAAYRFEPERSVNRGELSETVANVLVLLGSFNELARDVRASISDMSSQHLFYQSAALAVNTGVLATYSDGTFRPTTEISGAEAADAVQRLSAIVSDME